MTNQITIVITMAGSSKRFFDAGYLLPKYMLNLHGKSVFEHSIMSFKFYFKSNPFIFIIREINETTKFIKDICEKLNIGSYKICCLEEITKGQAETVLIGLERLNFNVNAPIMIFNIDTFRPNYFFPEAIGQWNGYLEVFKGYGTNWSYVKPESENSTKVIETAEKKAISELCSTGLYYFKSFKFFKEAYLNYYSSRLNSEHYIAPIYNWLINNYSEIYYHLIDRKCVVFCGTPKEFEELNCQKTCLFLTF